MKRHSNTTPFHSASTEEEWAELAVELPQTQSPSYRLAFADSDFLLRKSLRPIRLQLELLKPELALSDERIESTIVVFGSARITEPGEAKQKLSLAKRALQEKPNDIDLQQKVAIAEKLLEKSTYYVQARKLAKLISVESQSEEKRKYVVITGGGPGIMEAANRGAHDVNSKSIGLTIVLPLEEAPNQYITPELCFRFHYFAIRKFHFLIRARALVAFPGGLGTLDELFEALTLLQTQKMKPIPVLLFGKSYWNKIVDFNAMVEEGTISPEDLMLFQYVDTAEEAWQVIQDFYKVP